MSRFTHAILRHPGENFHQGLTTSALGVADYPLMLEQHAAYAAALRQLGLEIVILPPLPDFPDAYFVEDTAVVFPELAVIAQPGAGARKGEQEAMAPVLAEYRHLFFIQPPGTLDGGDVLVIDKMVFIGLSERTNGEGAEQLAGALQLSGYDCRTVPVGAGLHLKSSVGYMGEQTLLVTDELAQAPAFDHFEKIILDPVESYAANVLLINGRMLMPSGFPETRQKLEDSGLEIIELDVSEARKMDGGLSCMSLRF